ncbi:MAG: cell surface protein [bacterium]|nr:cell surface protein [bacterium]
MKRPPILFIWVSGCILGYGCHPSNPSSPLPSNAPDPFPDKVISVQFGDGAGFGQNFFPDNIFGPPDSSARASVPSADEREILTLGSGGEIILQFLDGGIENGNGPDFTIFENVFQYAQNQYYRETAFVSVSVNGTDWYPFPYDTTTFQGLAGVHPTNGNENYLDPNRSGGDSFDLSDVGLMKAYYIKITDTNGMVRDSGPSFDLDAVVAIYGENGN